MDRNKSFGAIQQIRSCWLTYNVVHEIRKKDILKALKKSTFHRGKVNMSEGFRKACRSRDASGLVQIKWQFTPSYKNNITLQNIIIIIIIITNNLIIQSL